VGIDAPVAGGNQAAPSDDRHAACDARVPIWDLATRAGHWLLAVAFGVSWWSAENRMMQWHLVSGYVILALVLFRIWNGFAGSSTARFAGFLRGPRAILAYLRAHRSRTAETAVGHNPLGGWSVVAMLALLAVQVALGLFAVDVDGIDSGPLAWLTTFENGRAAAEAHGVGFNLLLVLVGIHLAAIVYYFAFKRDNLVSAMIGGRKRGLAPRDAMKPASLMLTLLGLVLTLAITLAIAQGLPFLASWGF
jgi:cytochrome b